MATTTYTTTKGDTFTFDAKDKKAVSGSRRTAWMAALVVEAATVLGLFVDAEAGVVACPLTGTILALPGRTVTVDTVYGPTTLPVADVDRIGNDSGYWATKVGYGSGLVVGVNPNTNRRAKGDHAEAARGIAEALAQALGA